MSITELERDLDRQWNEAQLRADKALDCWIETGNSVYQFRRGAMFYCNLHSGTVRTFTGDAPSDARAQAAQTLIAEGF